MDEQYMEVIKANKSKDKRWMQCGEVNFLEVHIH